MDNNENEKVYMHLLLFFVTQKPKSQKSKRTENDQWPIQTQDVSKWNRKRMSEQKHGTNKKQNVKRLNWKRHRLVLFHFVFGCLEYVSWELFHLSFIFGDECGFGEHRNPSPTRGEP